MAGAQKDSTNVLSIQQLTNTKLKAWDIPE